MLSKPSNARVVVEPDCGKFVGDDDLKVCARIREAIERHVDEWAQVSIRYDMVCAACGSLWESPPGCCDAAIKGWQTEHPEWWVDRDYQWHKREASHAE